MSILRYLPLHTFAPRRPLWRSNLRSRRPQKASLSVQFPKAEGNQLLFLSLHNVTSNQRRVKRLLRLPKIPKNLALLLRCTLPYCRLIAWRRKPSNRLRWRTSGSSLDSSHLSRKANPSSYCRDKSPPSHNVVPSRGDAMLATSLSRPLKLNEVLLRTPSSFTFPPLFLIFPSCARSPGFHLLLSTFLLFSSLLYSSSSSSFLHEDRWPVASAVTFGAPANCLRFIHRGTALLIQA